MPACKVIVTRKSDKKQIELMFERTSQAEEQVASIQHFNADTYEAVVEPFTLRYSPVGGDLIEKLFKKKHG